MRPIKILSTGMIVMRAKYACVHVYGRKFKRMIELRYSERKSYSHGSFELWASYVYGVGLISLFSQIAIKALEICAGKILDYVRGGRLPKIPWEYNKGGKVLG